MITIGVYEESICPRCEISVDGKAVTQRVYQAESGPNGHVIHYIENEDGTEQYSKHGYPVLRVAYDQNVDISCLAPDCVVNVSRPWIEQTLKRVTLMSRQMPLPDNVRQVFVDGKLSGLVQTVVTGKAGHVIRYCFQDDFEENDNRFNLADIREELRSLQVAKNTSDTSDTSTYERGWVPHVCLVRENVKDGECLIAVQQFGHVQY